MTTPSVQLPNSRLSLKLWLYNFWKKLPFITVVGVDLNRKPADSNTNHGLTIYLVLIRLGYIEINMQRVFDSWSPRRKLHCILVKVLLSTHLLFSSFFFSITGRGNYKPLNLNVQWLITVLSLLHELSFFFKKIALLSSKFQRQNQIPLKVLITSTQKNNKKKLYNIKSI